MGGTGSGGGRAAQNTTSFLRLDLVNMRSVGADLGNVRNVIEWPNGSQASLEFQHDVLLISYGVPHNSDKQDRPFIDKVPLERMPQHLGGTRTWFRCPRCYRRCRVLYGAPFHCRQCRGATYPTQYQDALDRLFERAIASNLQIGGLDHLYGSFAEKPKWMRWPTYNRKKEEYERAQKLLWRVLDMIDLLLGEKVSMSEISRQLADTIAEARL